MPDVIIDTSSIIFGFENMKDVFEAVEDAFPGARLIVSRGVIHELEGIGKSGRRNGAYARAALKVLPARRVTVEEDAGEVDDWILRRSQKGIYVCTNDINLKKRLKMAGITTFSIARSGAVR